MAANPKREAQPDAEAQQMLLALGLEDPKLWPAIFARVKPEWCGYGFVGRVLLFASEQAGKGVLVGLAEAMSAVPDMTAQDRAFLAELRAKSPGEGFIGYWCDRVASSQARRELQTLSRQMWSASSKPDADPATVAGEAARELSRIVAPHAQTMILSADDWLREWRDEAQRRFEANVAGDAVFLPTGVGYLDAEIGVERGDLVIVAAETGVGKSAFGMSVARVAAQSGLSVLYANTEMATYQLVSRLVAAESGVSVSVQRKGWLSKAEWDAIADTEQRIRQAWRLWLTKPLVGVDADQLAIMARAHKATNGLDLLVLDYVGRLDTSPSSGEQREYQVLERIARSLKGLAQELQSAVYMLVQRTEEGHLAGSKRMRNEADVVLEIEPVEDEPGAKGQKMTERYPHCSHVIAVTKARSAASGRVVGVDFDRDKMTWRQLVVR